MDIYTEHVHITDPIEKKWKDIKPGDIIRTPYGDIDNLVTVIVDEIHENKDKNAIQIIGRYLKDGQRFTGYVFAAPGIDPYETATETVVGQEIRPLET